MGETAITSSEPAPLRLAVVIPCYRVRKHIASVLRGIGPEVWRVYCIDDACPEQSREIIEEVAATDPRVRLLIHERNGGVGAAVVTGYRQAVADGADIIVKVDGDGQMDPAKIGELVEPLARGDADYVKGNRFYYIESLRSMPLVRLVGNAGLSFLSKISTGYWHLFDPTNGFTAIQGSVARQLPLGKLSPRYFFESDILFRLNTLRAVVLEVPMDARYADERSNLNQWRALVEFPLYHARNCLKRIFYNYFLRGFGAASVNLIVGLGLLAFGVIFGCIEWLSAAERNTPASSGTVMLAALPIIIGSQMVLSFLNFDMADIPRDPIHRRSRPEARGQSRPEDRTGQRPVPLHTTH